MSDIEWRHPGPAYVRDKQTSVKAFVEQLKTRPGKWAVYKTNKTGGMGGQYKLSNPGTEWTQRKNDDGTITTFGRWVGTNGDEP